MPNLYLNSQHVDHPLNLDLQHVDHHHRARAVLPPARRMYVWKKVYSKKIYQSIKYI